MSGRIVDASLIAAPRPRNANEEKAAIKAGRVPDNWKDKPAKLRQKDQDARWTVKFTKAKPREDGSTPPVDLVGFIRKWSATDAAAAYEGHRLREGLSTAARWRSRVRGFVASTARSRPFPVGKGR